MGKRRSIQVTVPTNFLAKLGFRSRQRFVVVFWEGEIGEIMCYDGVAFKKAADQCEFVRLCCREDVALLLQKHRVKVGWSAQTVVTHWFLIDQQADRAFFMPVDQAYARVSPQKPIVEPRQMHLPFADE